MNASRPQFPHRVSKHVHALLRYFKNLDPHDRPWGYRMCQDLAWEPQRVYPTLEVLEDAGWVEANWETPAPTHQPRRVYHLTYAGSLQLERFPQPESRLQWWKRFIRAARGR